MSVIHRYKLDDSAANKNVADDVGVLTGESYRDTNILTRTGHIGSAFYYNGTEGAGADRVKLADFHQAAPFSMTGWFYKFTSCRQFVAFTNGFNYAGTGRGYMLRYDSGGLHPFKGHVIGAFAYGMPSMTWIMLTMTVDASGNMRVYADKAYKGTYYTSPQTYWYDHSYLGCEYNSDAGYILTLGGRADHIQYFDHELSQNEIDVLYDEAPEDIIPSVVPISIALPTPTYSYTIQHAFVTPDAVQALGLMINPHLIEAGLVDIGLRLKYPD